MLIPTRNSVRFLPETVQSVRQQQDVSFELVIVDNHSEDETEALCRQLVLVDDRIRYFRNPSNIGMAPNWNRCLGLARSDLVKCLMADDVLLGTQALARQVECFRKSPSVVLSTSSRRLINDRGEDIGDLCPLGKVDFVKSGPVLISRLFDQDAPETNPIGEPSAVLFRKSVGRGAFDTSFRQLVDLEMWLNVLQQGQLAYIAEPLCGFRQHDAQQTRRIVNTDLHEREEVRLCRSYATPEHLRRSLLQRCDRFSRSRPVECSAIVAELREELRVFALREKWARSIRKLSRKLGFGS